MYVCMLYYVHVCMYACMYVCMYEYVCMYTCVYVSVFPKARQTRNLRVEILKTEAAPLIKKGHARN